MDPTTGWPVLDGNYIVADPTASVAVCTLTDQQLPELVATLPGVAIVGTLATANLGIERLVTNVITNPAIGYLLVCGKDSPIFGPGQSLLALARTGTNVDLRIQDATGFDPVLRNLAAEDVDDFRTHIKVVDRIGVDDLATIAEQVTHLAARPVPRRDVATRAGGRSEDFVLLSPGGRRRRTVDYDPAGYLVITVDRPARQILVRHYRSDNTPAHQLRSRNGEAILLALLDHDLITQLDHAAYLGAELAKAETALRLGLRYLQDRPLGPVPPTDAVVDTTIGPAMPGTDLSATTRRADHEAGIDRSPATMPGRMPPVGPSRPAEILANATPGAEVQITIEVVREPDGQLLDAMMADPDPTDPYTRYQRTEHPVRVRYDGQTRIAMGTSADITIGALLRVRGTLRQDGDLHAHAVAILTNVATLVAT